MKKRGVPVHFTFCFDVGVVTIEEEYKMIKIHENGKTRQSFDTNLIGGMCGSS